MAAARRKRQTLGQGIDREVYQIVRGITDSHQQYDVSPLQLRFAVVYDYIRGSNSSLNRKPKKVLEDSIQRVLDATQEEADDSQNASIADEFADPEGSVEIPRKNGVNGVNKSIVKMWSTTAEETSKRVQFSDHPDTTGDKLEPSQTTKRRQANGEPATKKRKSTSSTTDKSPPTHVSLADLGGVGSVIRQFKKLLVLPMKRPEIYISSNVQPPRGILIHGPPGCGKTMIAHAFAAELGVNFISISAPSIVSGMSGESEKALREHFEEARKSAPCLIFIDEIDAITPKRESAQREMEKRIVAQLLICMDDLAMEKTDGKPVIVLAATNRPDSLDPALRRGGRFDKEINMSVPGELVREKILRALTRKMNTSDDIDFALLAKRTPGFVGADLNDLVSTAGSVAIERYLEILQTNSANTIMDVDSLTPNDDVSSLDPEVISLRQLLKYTNEPPSSTANEPPSLLVTNTDFALSLPTIQPSSLREGFATIPSTTFSDIGALRSHRTELLTTIIAPILKPQLYRSLGITSPPGLLLWGPPGCGKTLLAKAVANESKANFISVRGPELLNKYVGESERAVRQVFNRARSSVPVVIFFDELDALVPRRDGAMSEASARVVNTLLTELDGVGNGNGREGIYVLAATNRPDIIDPAMLRPGRLDTLLFVGLPGPEERVDILRTLIKRLQIPDFVFNDALADIARDCDGFTGADLESLLRRAGYAALNRGAKAMDVVDFYFARMEVRRSVSADEMRRYDELKKQWGQGLGVRA